MTATLSHRLVGIHKLGQAIVITSQGNFRDSPLPEAISKIAKYIATLDLDADCGIILHDGLWIRCRNDVLAEAARRHFPGRWVAHQRPLNIVADVLVRSRGMQEIYVPD